MTEKERTHQHLTISFIPAQINKNKFEQTKSTNLDHWESENKDQSKLECSRGLSSKHKLVEHLFSVRDTEQRQILTHSGISDHGLAVEKCTHKQTCLPEEERVRHCKTAEAETEEHFLLHCNTFRNTREHLETFSKLLPQFSQTNRMQVLLGAESRTYCCMEYMYLTIVTPVLLSNTGTSHLVHFFILLSFLY